jgi:cytochrome c oxidase cbb3-type subunit 3
MVVSRKLVTLSTLVYLGGRLMVAQVPPTPATPSNNTQQIEIMNSIAVAYNWPDFVKAVDIGSQTNPMAKQNVQRGTAKFQQSCALCHGAEAIGGAAPNLVESSLVHRDHNGNLIAPVIQEGRVDKGMPAFPLMTQTDISDIVAFLHTRIEVTNSVRSSSPGGGYSRKQFLTGNAESGKQYFNGKGHCATCHSPTADLAGIASKYSPAKLEARFLYPPHDNVTATIILPSGSKVKGKLLHLDAFYVAILNENGWYRSWPLREVKVRADDPLSGHLELLHNYNDKDIHNVFSYLETLK